MRIKAAFVLHTWHKTFHAFLGQIHKLTALRPFEHTEHYGNANLANFQTNEFRRNLESQLPCWRQDEDLWLLVLRTIDVDE